MGSYVDQNLVSSEKVLAEAHYHWIQFVPHVMLMIVGIGFITIFIPIIRNMTTEMAITNKRVIGKQGFVSRDTLELSHPKIESIAVDQPIMGRIFNYGTVSVRGIGGTVSSFKYVKDPISLRRIAAEASA